MPFSSQIMRFQAFGRALLAGHGLRRICSPAVLHLPETNVFSRQAVAHRLVVYGLRHYSMVAGCHDQ
jgi:hypothetical protein